MHRSSSALTSRYPQGIQSRRIARKLSASSALFRRDPARQGVRADSRGRMQGAYLFDAQRFDWLGVRVVHMWTVDKRTKRDAHSASAHVVEQAALRPAVCLRIRIGLSWSEFAGIHTRLAIRVRPYLLLAQRFALFVSRLSTYAGRPPSPTTQSLGQTNLENLAGFRRNDILDRRPERTRVAEPAHAGRHLREERHADDSALGFRIDPGSAFVRDADLEVAQILPGLRKILIGGFQAEQRRGFEADGTSIDHAEIQLAHGVLRISRVRARLRHLQWLKEILRFVGDDAVRVLPVFP